MYIHIWNTDFLYMRLKISKLIVCTVSIQTEKKKNSLEKISFSKYVLLQFIRLKKYSKIIFSKFYF
jgi:hypothetical protein